MGTFKASLFRDRVEKGHRLRFDIWEHSGTVVANHLTVDLDNGCLRNPDSLYRELATLIGPDEGFVKVYIWIDETAFGNVLAINRPEGGIRFLFEDFSYVAASAIALQESNDDRAWPNDHFRVFISHLTADSEQALELSNEMQQLGMYGWVAERDIPDGEDWAAEIESALLGADSLLALLSNGFIESRWTDQEVGFVMGQRKFALGLLMGQEPYGFLARIQAAQPSRDMNASKIDWRTTLDERLIPAFLRNIRTRHSLQAALIKKASSVSDLGLAERITAHLGTYPMDVRAKQLAERAKRDNEFLEQTDFDNLDI